MTRKFACKFLTTVASMTGVGGLNRSLSWMTSLS